jgi:hypothetical protein
VAEKKTALAGPTPLRWRNAWDDVTSGEIDALRDVIGWFEEHQFSALRLANEADVHPHDIRNFLSGTTRPGHRPGLRMLWFAAQLQQDASSTRPESIKAKIKILSDAARRLAVFEPDDDYFFRHLQRLGMIDEQDCKDICERISGHYYSHRLSRNPGKIIRSHYEFDKFSPFNRLPHFINRLKYGRPNDRAAVERTAEGQIVRLGNMYLLVGFVYRGYRELGKRIRGRKIKYDGLQINLFPAGQLDRNPPSIIEGLFLSYVYDERYEMGRMKLLRKKTSGGSLKFDPNQVGEFTVKEIHEMESEEPNLDLSELKLDVSRILEKQTGKSDMGKPDMALLAACLSFLLTPENIFPSP